MLVRGSFGIFWSFYTSFFAFRPFSERLATNQRDSFSTLVKRFIFILSFPFILTLMLSLSYIYPLRCFSLALMKVQMIM